MKNHKIILVDAWNTLVTEKGINQEIVKILDQYKNQKLVLTNANFEEIIKFGLVNLPYELFSLEHKPNKTDPDYFKILIEQEGFEKSNLIYFEHNIKAVKSAQSCGIITYHFNHIERNYESLNEFLKNNLN